MREAVGVFGGLQHEVQVADDCLRLTRRQAALQRADLLDVLPVLLRLTGDGRVVLRRASSNRCACCCAATLWSSRALLVLGLSLLSPGRVLRGGEHPTQGRRAFHREVALARRRWRRSDRRAGRRRGTAAVLEGLEVQVVVDTERRRQHALQDLDLLLDLGRVVGGLLRPVLRVQRSLQFLVLHGRECW